MKGATARPRCTHLAPPEATCLPARLVGQRAVVFPDALAGLADGGLCADLNPTEPATGRVSHDRLARNRAPELLRCARRYPECSRGQNAKDDAHQGRCY